MCNRRKKIFESNYNQSNNEFLKLIVCFFTQKYSGELRNWERARKQWEVVGLGKKRSDEDYCICGESTDNMKQWIIQYKYDPSKYLFPIGNVCVYQFDNNFRILNTFAKGEMDNWSYDLDSKASLLKAFYNEDQKTVKKEKASASKIKITKDILNNLNAIFEANKEEIIKSKEYKEVEEDFFNYFNEKIDNISIGEKKYDTFPFLTRMINKGSNSVDGSNTKVSQKDKSKSESDRYRFLITRFIKVIYVFAREKYLERYDIEQTREAPVVQYLSLSDIEEIKREFQRYCIAKHGMTFGEGEYIDIDLTTSYKNPSNY